MSDLGPSPEVTRPSPDDAASVPGWVLGVAVVVALALAGALGFAILRGGGDIHHVAAPPAPPAHHYPAHWDKRIAPYAVIAAKQRGLTFTHPVQVRFLAPAAFAKSVETDDSALTKSDRKQLKQGTALLRAFGLLHGNVDLLGAVNDFSGADVLAYYSFEDKRITVRGHRITPSVRSTLVHELTHVLQDQHFDVGSRLQRLGAAAKKGPSSSRSDILHALVEGDAERVEGLYRDSLSEQQRRALTTAQQAEADQAKGALARIPKIVVTLMTSPYTLGEGLVQTAAALGGNNGVNRLLSTPPAHESALLDPLGAVAGQVGAATVPTPHVPPGAHRFDSGELGALTWYLMLASRLGPRTALATTDGWHGDAYVAYTRGGQTCAQMSYSARTRTGASTMRGALQRWIAAAPGTAARVGRKGSLVTFETCDPGQNAQLGSDNSSEAIQLVLMRTALADNFVRSGGIAHATTARCFAARLVQNFTVPQLSDPSFGQDDPSFQATMGTLLAACR